MITLPLLSSVNKVLVLVMFLHTFNDFSTPFVLFGGSAPPAGDLISVHIYQSSFATWNFCLVWMLVGYFDTVPRDLDEAAKVDGAGPLRTLLQIIVPAATPGIVAVCIYAFMTAWGEVLFASVLTDTQTRTLAVGLQAYSTEANVYWNQVMAASLVVSVPVVAGFLLLQRFLITGFTAGAVK
ncbi:MULTISPECIES: ABC transporter permease subunit [unclassified Streptomyces]|uniref:ABC transporter permease subunit n=1 Tax=unclassified Streptomyces TaxID=2593676 RepID=UPI00386849DF